jgi:hypothetical protein
MQLIVFIGVQAAGKSTFFKQNFVDTHIRINLDMLKTRHREQILFQACLEAKQPLVIDNTNPTRSDRARYVLPAKAAHFQAIAYYFDTSLADALTRNAARQARIPEVGIRATFQKLQQPEFSEYFDEIYHVRPIGNQQFMIEKQDAI